MLRKLCVDVRISSRWHAEWATVEEMLFVDVTRVKQCEVFRLCLCWPGKRCMRVCLARSRDLEFEKEESLVRRGKPARPANLSEREDCTFPGSNGFSTVGRALYSLCDIHR